LNALYFLINTNIYISLAAVLLTIETQVQLGMKPQFHPYLIIIFFATLFEYNLHRLVTAIIKPEALNDAKHKWVKQNLKMFYVLTAISVLGLIYVLFLAKKTVLIALAPFALITLLYSLPVYKRKEKIYRIREIPFLKIFIIAFIWSVITIFLPIIYNHSIFNRLHVTIMFAERFIFVFAIAIPFDIRDMSTDLKAGIKTIPLLFGEKKAKNISNILIIIFLILTATHYISFNMIFLLPAFLISGIITLIIINHKKFQKSTWYYYAILDGTLLIQGLLAWVSYFIYSNYWQL